MATGGKIDSANLGCINEGDFIIAINGGADSKQL